MHANQQQSSSVTINRIVQLLQSGILKEKILSGKISHEEISRLINDVISSSEDDAVKLHRSKRNIGNALFIVATYLYRWYTVSKRLGLDRGTQVFKRHLGTKKGQQKALDTLKDALDEVETLGDIIDILKRFLYSTEAPHVTTTQLTTERQHVTKSPHSTRGQQVTTEKQSITVRQQVTTEVPKPTERQQVKEDYSNTSLHLAAEKGDLNAVKYFIEKGDDVNDRDRSYVYTPLHYAARNGHLNIVKYLIDKGSDVNITGWRYFTPLHLAAQNGHLDVVKYLISSKASVNMPYLQMAPLHLAADNGHLDIVKYLIGSGANIDAKNGYFNTPLHGAVIKGHSDVVKYLIDRGADVNAKGNNDTPLHEASERGHLDMVKYLVEKGADLTAMSTYYGTPLHRAAEKGHLDIVKYLIDSGADLNIAAVNNSFTPLHEAAQNGHLDVVKYLIDSGADLNAKNSHGNTPLHLAVKEDHLDIAKCLLEKGADINIENEEMINKTPLEIARTRDNPQIVELLSSYKLGNRNRRDVVLSNSLMNNSVNWLKSFLPSSTGSPTLLSSRGHDRTTVIAVPEVNTTVVNNTLILGILATSMLNKTHYKQPIPENLLSPRDQIVKYIDDSSRLLEESLQKAKEDGWGSPSAGTDKVKIIGNKTGMWK